MVYPTWQDISLPPGLCSPLLEQGWMCPFLPRAPLSSLPPLPLSSLFSLPHLYRDKQNSAYASGVSLSNLSHHPDRFQTKMQLILATHRS